MPANLNALIRYKTINSCLYGGKRRWDIHKLIKACSEALAETRGRYNTISERTIRDDIRIMRSDILGFNAPILQVRGLYYYADPEFSILNLRITDAGLADKIYLFLLGIRTEMKHPELEIILEQLCQLTKREYEKPIIVEETDPEIDHNAVIFRKIVIEKRYFKTEPSLSKSSKFRITEEPPEISEAETVFDEQENLSWGRILEKIYLI